MQKTAAIIREEKKKQTEEERKRINDIKSSDPDNYLRNLYDKRKEILDRMTEKDRLKE